jgi:hypothetical protein
LLAELVNHALEFGGARARLRKLLFELSLAFGLTVPRWVFGRLIR